MDYRSRPPSMQDVEAGGVMLLHNFFHEQFVREELPEEELVQVENKSDEFGELEHVFRHEAGGASSLAASTPEGYTAANLVEIGRYLSEHAAAFDATQESSLIRERANQVDVSRINREGYFRILNEIFSRHRIVALFSFCAGVLIRCVREVAHQVGARLFSWAIQFLVEQVCLWVLDQGGWDRVFSSHSIPDHRISSIVAMSAAVVILISGAVVWVLTNF